MSKIDVHQHVFPDAFYQALEDAGGDPTGWPIPEWSLEAVKKFMKDEDIRTSILSVTTPGPMIQKDKKAQALLARQCNEFVAKLRDDNPSAFGFFASLPSIVYEDVAREELTYAFDELHADGVTLFTRYGRAVNDDDHGPEDDDPLFRNHYLGHPNFAWLWEELNRRAAVVFVHPTPPADSSWINKDVPPPVFDLPHETGRAALDLITSDRLRTSPQCKIILSHAGGTFPYLAYRAAGMLPYMPNDPVGKTTGQIINEAQEFYFDTSLSSNPATLSALFKFAKSHHVLFGTDFPSGFEESIEYFTNELTRFEMDQQQRNEVYREAAFLLFPRLRPRD